MSEEQVKQDTGSHQVDNVSDRMDEKVERDIKQSADAGASSGPSEQDKRDTRSTQSNYNIGSVGDNAEIAQEINKEIKNILIGGGEGINFQIKKFSISTTIPISEDSFEEADKTFVYLDDKIDGIFSHLISNRMLFLVGEPGAGKYFTAKYLSNRIKKENKKDYDVRLVKPVTREVIIELFELIDNPNTLKGKILIFKDVFLKKNRNLLDFFTSYTREQTKLFSKNLKELDSYILFTADYDTFDEFEISGLDIKEDILMPNDELIGKGFELKLKHFCLVHQKEFEVSYSVLKGRVKEIIKKFDRMWKITLFIENYLERILEKKKKIEDAIEEVNDIKKRVEYWFLRELGENKEEFEAWTFTLCLALLNGVSYVDFEEIHRVITKKLLRVITPYSADKTFSFSLSENDLLVKCNAQITKDEFIYADLIEFCDSRYQKILMDTLLKNNRRILINITSFLQEYVENPYLLDLRRLAAYCIGRIGELDLESITLHLIRKWEQMDEAYYRANVGYLFEGILNSEDENYRKFCLGYLRNMALSNNIKIQWTAISAYKQIGLHNLGLAMKELRNIQEKIIELWLKTEDMLDIFCSITNDIYIFNTRISDVVIFHS